MTEYKEFYIDTLYNEHKEASQVTIYFDDMVINEFWYDKLNEWDALAATKNLIDSKDKDLTSNKQKFIKAKQGLDKTFIVGQKEQLAEGTPQTKREQDGDCQYRQGRI